MKKTFFIDFDGTITTKDVCETMVETFAADGWREINEKWERKELSTKDCANMTFQLFKAGIDEVTELIETIEIDSSFKDFLHFCRLMDYKAYILSDGYDYCIKTILGKYGIQVPYYANKMIYNQVFTIECPFFNESCGNCGTCKTKLMAALKEEESQAVYIGDGYSDTCPAAHADVVFAKDKLYRYCMEKGINAVYYDTFADILAYFG